MSKFQAKYEVKCTQLRQENSKKTDIRPGISPAQLENQSQQRPKLSPHYERYSRNVIGTRARKSSYLNLRLQAPLSPVEYQHYRKVFDRIVNDLTIWIATAILDASVQVRGGVCRGNGSKSKLKAALKSVGHTAVDSNCVRDCSALIGLFNDSLSLVGIATPSVFGFVRSR